MRTVSIFTNGKNQAVRLPRDMEYQEVSELEIIKNGDVVTLRPIRPGWLSLANVEKPDSDFLTEREDMILDEGRFDFEEEN
jgi:antitoxin VapB